MKVIYDNNDTCAVLYLPITKGDKDDYRHLAHYAVDELRRWLEISEIKVLAETGFSWYEFLAAAFGALSLFVVGRKLKTGTV